MKKFNEVGSGESLYIKHGINDNVKVGQWTYPEVQSDKSSYIQVELTNSSGETGEFKLYTSPAAEEKTLIKIKHMLTKHYSEEEVNNMQYNTWDQLTNLLNKMLKGKVYTKFKFTGEEILGKEDDNGVRKPNWFKAKIGFVPFCAVSPEDCAKLKFNDDNKYDLIRLIGSDANPSVMNSKVTETDNLPF